MIDFKKILDDIPNHVGYDMHQDVFMQSCGFNLTEEQLEWLGNINETHHSIFKKVARGCGITILLQLYAVWYAATNDNSFVLFICKDSEIAARTFIDTADKILGGNVGMNKTGYTFGKKTDGVIRCKNGSTIRYVSSTTQLRGIPDQTCVIMDDVAMYSRESFQTIRSNVQSRALKSVSVE